MADSVGGKYEAICALGTDRARRIGAQLLARPAREPLWEALVNAVLAYYEGADQVPDKDWLAGLTLVLTAPAIRGEYLKITSAMQEALAEAIAARTGMGVEQDMYSQVLAGAVTAAAQVAVRRWFTADPPSRSARCCDPPSTSSPRPAPGCRPAPGGQSPRGRRQLSVEIVPYGLVLLCGRNVILPHAIMAA